MNDAAVRPRLPWLDAPLAQARRQRAHALLVHGPSGVGQFEMAVALAETWLCEHDDEAARPCGRCVGCRQMSTRRHPDCLLLAPAALLETLGWAGTAGEEGEAEGGGSDGGEGGARSKAKPSRDIRVDEVRRAIAWTQQTSSRGRGKVLLLHPATAMNAVAANALLKTLEEPPSGVRMVLTASDPETLLPTIRSRCQRLALSLPTNDEALCWLDAHGVADAAVLLAAAGGRPQDALALHREGFDATRWQRLPRAVAAGDAAPLSGCTVARAVDTLNRLCHDLMLGAAGAAPRYFAPGCLPAGASLPALAAWARTLQRAARHDEHPWNAPLLLEALVASGRRCFPAAAATLAAR